MNIAIFSDNFYPEISGISDSILLAGHALARRGHTVDFFAPAYSKKDYAKSGTTMKEPPLEKNSSVYRIMSIHYPTPTTQGRLVFPNIFRALSAKKYDVIHTHQFFGAGLDALMLSKFKHIPFVGTNHTHIESFTPLKIVADYMIWYYNKCTLVTSPARFLIDDMKKKGLRGEPLLVSNPIEDEFFTDPKPELKQKLGLSPFVFLYAGRISPEKGVDVLLDSFIASAKDMPDASLVFVGGGSMKEKLMETAQRSDVSAQILFKGPYIGEGRKDLYDLFHAADVFTIASTSEIQSMVVLQAMASGLPTIAADAGGLPALLGENRGLLFEADNRAALSLALRKMYDNADLRKQMGQSAKQFALERRSDAIAAEWEKVYSRAIQEYKK